MALELDSITSGYNLSKINTNFQKVEDYINDKLLARAQSGMAGEAKMERDLDMDGHTILNADLDGSSITNDRAIRVPASEAALAPLPEASNRLGKVLSFHPTTGLPVVLAPASGSAVDVLNQLALSDGAKLVGYKNGSTLYDLQNWVTPQMFGAKGDGVTDDTTAIQAASTYATTHSIKVYFPAATYISSKITVDTNTCWVGDGIGKTILKLKSGSNTDLVYGAGSDALWGTQSLGGVKNFSLSGMTLDGNKAGNTAGSAYAVYGQDTRVDQVSIINAAKYGMRTEWADSGDPDGGMEGFFSNIIIDKSGEHGWRFAGPHDSVVSNVIIISSSQKTSGNYDGLFLERGNARWKGIHIWTSANDLRSRYALNIAQAAQGNEFSLSHFEGANKNVLIDGNNNTLDSSCKVYYPWDQDNIIINGSNVRIECFIGEEYKGIGLPLATGISFGGTFGGPSGCIVDAIINGCEAGAMYFGASAGYNTVRVRGYSAAATSIGYGGAPAAADMVDLVISGGNLSIFKKDIANTNYPVLQIAATGSTQGDATSIGAFNHTVQLNGGAAGAGIKLPNATTLGTGSKVTVVNTTGNSLKVYPQSGHNILGIGVNGPLTLIGLQGAIFTVSNAAAGEWLVVKGA